MNTEIVTEPKAITELAAAIIASRTTETSGRATYLRCLLAGLQIDLVGAPVLRGRRGAQPGAAKALETLEKVNQVYYPAVLAAVPAGMAAAEKNAATGFARSAASTLRRAIRLGWNPLTAVGTVTKYTLGKYSDEHATPRKPSAAAVQKRVDRYIERIGHLIEGLPKADADALLAHAVAELGGAEEARPQRIVRSSVRRQEIRPH